MILITLNGLGATDWYQSYNFSIKTELFGFFYEIIFSKNIKIEKK